MPELNSEDSIESQNSLVNPLDRDDEIIANSTKDYVDGLINAIEAEKQGETKEQPNTLEIEAKKISIDFKNNYTQNATQFIQQLCSSPDTSTKNLGLLLDYLYQNKPSLYEYLYKKIIDRLDLVDNQIVYSGPSIDTYKLNSMLIFLDSTNDSLGKLVLDDLIIYFETDYELASEFKYLKRYIQDYYELDYNQGQLYYLLDALQECFDTGDKYETIDYMRKLVILINNGLTVQEKRSSGYYLDNNKAIFIDYISNTNITAIHELAHAIDLNFSQRNFEETNFPIIDRARERILNNQDLIKLIEVYIEMVKLEDLKTKKMFDERMTSIFGSKEKALDYLEESIKKGLLNGNIRDLYDSYNLDDELIDKIEACIKDNALNKRKLAEILYDEFSDNLRTRTIQKMEEANVLDIVSNIFGGYKIPLKNGEIINLGCGHNPEYYAQIPDHRIRELYANISELLLHGQTEILEKVKIIIGDELYNYIIEQRNIGRIINSPQPTELERKIS